MFVYYKDLFVLNYGNYERGNKFCLREGSMFEICFNQQKSREKLKIVKIILKYIRNLFVISFFYFILLVYEIKGCKILIYYGSNKDGEKIITFYCQIEKLFYQKEVQCEEQLQGCLYFWYGVEIVVILQGVGFVRRVFIGVGFVILLI